MKKPSQTAELAALARASLTKEAAPVRGNDTLAESFLAPHYRAVLHVEPLRRLVRAILVSRLPGAYGHLAARSKHIDAVVAQELARGATQLVVMGAGYDTRAYRFASALGAGRAFEIDAPATSEKKRARVQKTFGTVPAHVTYVAVDFEKQSTKDALLAAGFERDARTIFTWEGVTFYINDAAVNGVLSFVGTCGKGSAIVFDYLHHAVVANTLDDPWARRSALYVRNKGEPFTFGLDPEAVAGYLDARGLTLETHLDAAALERSIGAPQEDALRVAKFYGLAVARV